MAEHNPTEQSKRMIPTCLKREYRVAVTDEEFALYQTLVDRHPHMLSEDYWPYESVCIEWGEREATWIDDLPEFIPRIVTESPLGRLTKDRDSDATIITWGWGAPDSGEDE